MSFVEQPIGHAAAHRAEADKSHVSHKLAVLLLSATRYHMLTDGEIGVVSAPMETTVTTHSTAAPAAARRTVLLDLWGQVLIGVLIAIVVGYAGSTSL